MNILEKLTLIDPQILLNGTKTSSNSFLKSCLYMDTTLSSKSSTGIFDPASNQTKKKQKKNYVECYGESKVNEMNLQGDGIVVTVGMT